MASKKLRAKKVSSDSAISVEGSRALEPQVMTEEMSHTVKSSKLTPKTLAIASLVIVLLLLLIGLPVWYIYTQDKASQQSKDPTLAAQNQIKSLTAEVGKVMVLPTDETPQLATVSDKTKLAGQAFFLHAENGDKVLIYTNAKKAILYRPSVKKIIEVGPINITGDAGAPNAQVAGATTTVTPTPASVSVGLLNGTTVVGLTKKVEASLTAKIPTVTVSVKDNAAKNDYATTSVIAATSAGKAAAAQVATAVKGNVVSLPAGEVVPANTDILIILGQNAAQ